jgi:hypothetical protein
VQSQYNDPQKNKTIVFFSHLKMINQVNVENVWYTFNFFPYMLMEHLAKFEMNSIIIEYPRALKNNVICRCFHI